MIGEKDKNVVDIYIIDEKKEISPYRMRRGDGITHQMFPDHNVMISVMNWVQYEENKNSYNKSDIHKVQSDAANDKGSKIREMSLPQQPKYDIWSDKII